MQAVVHIRISDEDYIKLMMVLGYAAMVAGGNNRAMWVLANSVGNAINAGNPNWNDRWECIATLPVVETSQKAGKRTASADATRYKRFQGKEEQCA